MKVLSTYHETPPEFRGAVLAIGNFDGVHRGHQAVIADVQAIANGIEDKSARATQPLKRGALYFDPHPRRFFAPDRPHFTLTPPALKHDLLAALGLDVTVILPFDQAMAARSPEAFVKDVLMDGLQVRHVIVGYDFHFGAKRSGTPDSLAHLGQRHGFGVTIVAPQVGAAGKTAPATAFSSTRVREHLVNGEVRQAADILGYWWRMRGTVMSGAGRGHGLGYPTANVALHQDQALAHGIYAVRIHVDGEVHDGAAYLGTRPTFDNGAPVLETFLFEFDGNLYGRDIEVVFIARLRGDQAFATPEALAVQMDADCAMARKVLRDLQLDDPMRAFPLGELMPA